MATVHRAHDARHGRDVAVKVMLPAIAESLGAERFLREIETAARLQHPHIVPVFDSGNVDGQLFFVMPLIEGESLRGRLQREGRLDVEEAVRIVREVADALEYAHSEGVVHRDLKPENILMSRGHALLADFGIARAAKSKDNLALTQAGMSLGTPSYMSPELAAGETDVGPTSDVYALGCILFELLTGSCRSRGTVTRRFSSSGSPWMPRTCGRCGRTCRRRATTPSPARSSATPRTARPPRVRSRIRWRPVSLRAQAVELSHRGAWPMAKLGCALVGLGRHDEARALLAELEQRAHEATMSAPAVATLHLHPGHRDEFYRWINRGIDERDPFALSQGNEFLWNSVRHEPEFQNL